MADLGVDKAKTALIVADVQNDQYGQIEEANPERKDLPQRIRKVIDACRAANVMVVYVMAQFRKGHPEAHPRNKFQMHNKQVGRLQEGAQSTQIHEAVAPRPDEVIITKRRVNAFYNTDLATVLNAQGKDTLILAGIASSGVILSTVRYAADADYALVILEDCCADRDPEVHRVLMEKVFPGQATVTSAAEFLKAIGA
jgi:nicotinamidase-related amidase